MKKILTAAASAAMLLASVAPALAWYRPADAENRNTGRNSTNVAVSVEADVVLVRNNNAAFLTSTTSMSGANSGANLSKNNDGNATITTHTASSAAVSDALVNGTTTEVGPDRCCDFGEPTARNVDTGRESTNVAIAADVDVVAVRNNNLAIGTMTTSMSGANSGANTAQGNDGDATITAGSADSSAISIATVNTSVTRIYR